LKVILGLDQGFTKTHAIVSDLAGNLLALGQAQGSLHTQRGIEEALLRMRQAAQRALDAAGIGWPQVLAVSGGITGIDYPYEKELLTRELQKHFGVDQVNVHNDSIGALWGGVFAGPAVVCCAGTGLGVGGADGDGQCLALGNYANGPHQGATSIGQSALQAVFDAHIYKEPPTLLTRIFLDHLGYADVDELLLHRYRKGDMVVAELCPLVFEAAGQGDAAARGILTERAENWSKSCVSVMRLLNIDPTAPVRVILSGSVFKGRPGIPRQRMEAVLAGMAPGATVEQARYEPIVGGAVMGLFYLGVGDWRHNVVRSAEKLGLLRDWGASP